MSTRLYYDKWRKNEGVALLNYLATLNQVDWDELFDDFYFGRHQFLLRIFKLSKQDTLRSEMLTTFEELDSKTTQLINKSIKSILKICIDKNNQETISEIIHAINFLELEIEQKVFFKIISNTSFNEEVRSRSAIVLSTNYKMGASNFWDGIDLAESLFLIPSYIYFNQNIDPVKGLSKLSLMEQMPSDISMYELPVRDSLYQITQSNLDRNKFNLLRSTLPIWVNEYFDELIASYDGLDSFKQTPITEKIRFAISPFPESALIEYFMKIGLFSKYYLDVELLYFHWNKLLYSLIGKEAHVIMGNKKVAEFENNKFPGVDPPPYHYWFDFNKFTGFAIAAQSNLPFKPYNTFHNEMALKSILLQCMGKDKKIIASHNTDHYHTLEQLIQKAELNVDDFNIIGEWDPYEGFNKFMEYDEYDFYIGGANLIEKARQSGKKIILSAKDVDIGAVQYNGLISLTADRDIVTKNTILKFAAAIGEGIAMLQNSSDVWDEIYQLFCERLKTQYPNTYDRFIIPKDAFFQVIEDVMEFGILRPTNTRHIGPSFIPLHVVKAS